MAGKSTGQILGTVVGAAVGFFIPGSYVALGATLGGMVGGLLDPPKGADTFGPRLDDLSVQTSTYGAPIGRAYGTVMNSGNLYWLEGDALREHTKTESQGGKGGGGSEYTSYSYTATFAVGLMKVSDPTQTVALRRLWVGDILFYDAGSDNIESIIASNTQTSGFTFYNGADDQPANPRMQADKGAANVSSYPGLVHIDFDDLDLTPYSNTLLRAQVRAELVVGNSTSDWVDAYTLTDSADYGSQYRKLGAAIMQKASCDYYITSASGAYTIPYALTGYRDNYGEGTTDLGSVAIPDTWGTPYTWAVLNQCIAVDTDSSLAVFVQERGGSPTTRLRFVDLAGRDEYSIEYQTSDFPSAAGMTFSARGQEVFLHHRGGMKIVKFAGIALVASTSASYSVLNSGLSDNYLFAVAKTLDAGNTTVYKFSRDNLALVATYTQAIPDGSAAIHVVNDDVFYTAANGHIHKWIGGVVVADFGVCTGYDVNLADTYQETRLHVVDDSPPFGSYIAWIDSNATKKITVFYQQVAANSASLREIVGAECGLVGITAGDIDLDDLTDSAVRGFKIANPGSVRAPLEQLQAAYPFDVAQSGYKIRFVSRGGASVASIPEADLGVVAGGEQNQTLLPITREMDSQIAARVMVRHIDPSREYDVGEQFAERPSTASVSERSVDLAIVLTSQEAAQIADVLNQKDWLERRDFGPFTLPPTYRHLEPADVVTLSHRGQSHSLRLTRVEYLPDGWLSCSARQTSAACYTSTATGEDPLALGQSLVPLHGTTTGYLLDIPRIRSEQDAPGQCFALLGKASGWPGGVLVRSDDSWNTIISCGSMNDRARVFSSGAPLAGHHGYSADFSSVLQVTPINPDAELSGVTEEQFYSQANLAAYGIDGRWEIVAFRAVVDNSGSYSLSGFLRGLYGSAWASGLHADGDLFIMLDVDTVGFFGLPTNALGVSRPYRAITQGRALDSSADMIDSYEARNLQPLPPVDVTGDRSISNFDWTIRATRRTRWPVELFSGVTVPLGESAESYELELWNSGYSTRIRLFSGLTSPVATWTGAMQITDVGTTNNPNIYYRWYQLSSVIGRGLVSQGSLYRSIKVNGDGFDDAIMALSPIGYYKMDGNTTTLTDSSASANNGTLSATNVVYQEPALFTGAAPGYAIRFTTGYASVPHIAAMNGAFTWVFLMKPASIPGAESWFLHKGDNAVGGSQGHAFSVLTSGKLRVTWYAAGAWRTADTTAAFFTAGQSAVIAFRYNGSNTLSVFRNGVKVEDLTISVAFANNAYPLTINGVRTTTVAGFTPNNTIDDFALFSSQLSDAQIAALYEEA